MPSCLKAFTNKTEKSSRRYIELWLWKKHVHSISKTYPKAEGKRCIFCGERTLIFTAPCVPVCPQLAFDTRGLGGSQKCSYCIQLRKLHSGGDFWPGFSFSVGLLVWSALYKWQVGSEQSKISNFQGNLYTIYIHLICCEAEGYIYATWTKWYCSTQNVVAQKK